jgi:hypothetical protein
MELCFCSFSHLWSSLVNVTWISLLPDLLLQVTLICLVHGRHSEKGGIFI